MRKNAKRECVIKHSAFLFDAIKHCRILADVEIDFDLNAKRLAVDTHNGVMCLLKHPSIRNRGAVTLKQV